jgi:hypothetical protein
MARKAALMVVSKSSNAAAPTTTTMMMKQQRRWMGHSVRLIALEDLPHGKGYQGDVVHVKAGYARNFLVPKQKAVYATPQNFEKLNIVDPQKESEEQRLERLQRESSMSKTEEQYLKQADLLKKFLRTKVVSNER